MKLYQIILISCLSILCSIGCHAQERIDTISLLDFKRNTRSEIRFIEDWSKERILLIDQLRNDTLIIPGVSEVESKEVLNDSFLAVIYRVRTGSGMHVRQTRLFAVKDHKVYNSLAFVSRYQTYSSEGQLHESFAVDVKVIGHSGTFLLELTEHITRTGDAAKRSVKKHVRNLLFDKQRIAFVLEKASRESSSVICGQNSKRSNDRCNALNLKTNKYLYCEGKWYLKSNKGCYDLF